MKAIELSNRSKLGMGPQVLVVLLVIALASAMAIGPTRQLFEQKARISGMQNDLDTIERSNGQLEKRIARLRDPDYLETLARSQSGLVHEGEKAFVVMPPSQVPGLKAQHKHEAAGPPPPDPSFVDGLLDFIGLR